MAMTGTTYEKYSGVDMFENGVTTFQCSSTTSTALTDYTVFDFSNIGQIYLLVGKTSKILHYLMKFDIY